MPIIPAIGGAVVVAMIESIGPDSPLGNPTGKFIANICGAGICSAGVAWGVVSGNYEVAEAALGGATPFYLALAAKVIMSRGNNAI